MPITAEQIDIWRQSRSEHQRLEFKEAKEQYDFRKLCQYCVALANEGGGANRLEISNPGKPIVPVERFIDGYQSRNERMATLMRRMGICEEKSSGIDRVVHNAEMYQLPAPDFRVSGSRTLVIIYGPRKFEDMDRDDRIRACYQHAALKWVMSERMTNQSLRERFRLPESKSAVVSQTISAAIDTGMVKSDESVGGSRKFARYLPFWA